MTRCAKATGAGQRSCGVGSCAQRVMPKPIFVQTAGYASNVSEVRL